MKQPMAYDLMIRNAKRIHMIGIGGSGMSPLAELLHGLGHTLTGSDNNPSYTLDRVKALGIPVAMGHRAENVGDADLVIYSAAIQQDNPELVEANRRGIPTLERSYLLGAVTNGVSSLQNIKLDTAGIRDLFDVVVVSGDIGIYKPDRRIFDEACRRAGLKNEEVLFVGDHPVNDIDGALGAGLQVIRMNYGDFYNKGLGKATAAEIEDIRQVLDFV